ncbi:Hypothetical predicted protein [Podarcis lilfordi]|uniref:Uncharacterized protein n=1 Tax=Podarcis lilfordi TaxID=74358 RepID=A0AA35NS82_9SAUR|nr:Hypothetical predicted protein [Podarcis lilfordi]
MQENIFCGGGIQIPSAFYMLLPAALCQCQPQRIQKTCSVMHRSMKKWTDTVNKMGMASWTTTCRKNWQEKEKRG